MRQIRRNVFETNSSSTHCLTFSNKCWEMNDEDSYFTSIDMEIRPYTPEEADEYMMLTSIEEKLRYFYTLYLQTGHSDNATRDDFMRLAMKVFPNVRFVFSLDYDYVLEDGEYLFDDYYGEAEVEPLLNEDTFKKFMLYGTIYFGNRDNEAFYNTMQMLKNEANFTINFSG